MNSGFHLSFPSGSKSTTELESMEPIQSRPSHWRGLALNVSSILTVKPWPAYGPNDFGWSRTTARYCPGFTITPFLEGLTTGLRVDVIVAVPLFSFSSRRKQFGSTRDGHRRSEGVKPFTAIGLSLTCCLPSMSSKLPFRWSGMTIFGRAPLYLIMCLISSRPMYSRGAHSASRPWYSRSRICRCSASIIFQLLSFLPPELLVLVAVAVLPPAEEPNIRTFLIEQRSPSQKATRTVTRPDSAQMLSLKLFPVLFLIILGKLRETRGIRAQRP
mmetsp:Transcript_32777/g.79738  ORF Transcript_32777/g.79738 Transcript_32777/m.79738 type:complete len:272 (+) Transcript_32777:1984-2799(+)